MRKFWALLLVIAFISQTSNIRPALAGGSILYAMPSNLTYFFRIAANQTHPFGHKIEDYLTQLFYHDENVQLFDQRTFANIFVVAQGPSPDDAKKLVTYYFTGSPPSVFDEYLAKIPKNLLKKHQDHLGTPYYSLGNLFFDTNSGNGGVTVTDNEKALINQMHQEKSIVDSQKFNNLGVDFEEGILEAGFDFDALRLVNPKILPGVQTGAFAFSGGKTNFNGNFKVNVRSKALQKRMIISKDFLRDPDVKKLLLYPNNEISQENFDKVFSVVGGGKYPISTVNNTHQYMQSFYQNFEQPKPFGCSELPSYDINTQFQAPINDKFQDVKSSDSWYPALQNLQQKGIIQGYNTPAGRYFYPERDITRAEFTKLALAAQVKVLGEYGDIGPQFYFFDVSPCEWYAPYVNKAFAFHFIKSRPDGNFKPLESITKAEALQIFYNANYELQSDALQKKEIPWKNIHQSDWFYKAIKSAYNEGLLDQSKKFDPHANLKRSEAIQILNAYFLAPSENS